ncbi:probable glycosyltransferase STELLO2 [Aristolochia californica]|uniref:probable glycosyltransferase STELLO2 n=1 Tax=Aristolochia californica TaxID=171875 RepID=UPI0035DAAA93
MLVQDRAAPKPSKPHPRSLSPLRFSEPKSLDFSTWLSDNLYKVLTVGLLIGAVAIFFLLRNFADTAAILCLESRAESITSIPYPKLAFNSIPANSDSSSPYASFRAERWIVVSVFGPPSDTLRNLAKIKGWQLLAIASGDTPPDWSLKGAIFLSLDDQVKLNYRVLDHLPYNSFVRKTVGYLYAIQHGAKKIFDADDRAHVIDSDLGKHFDLELVGEEARRHTILQYSHDNPNRTVINPYTHFGQRSVWPRGLPLENVGEVAQEEFYTEIYSGKQFIQQGLSNGLPDVDSVFYFTRKSQIEAFDIKFDDEAPKVALPQGIMVPVNSFNTIFHSSAFWGLMLPVSVSSMASDVLRGYWAQRILWEIEGFVVVYPPTIYRYDRIESYPFSEEKDLHVNVGRLIKFLVSLRTNKPTLFEKILHLSYVMAEEGFWTEQDVRFTAAWLQDLLAVDYQQPRLMSLELDRPRAQIGHGDRKEFIPHKLPSVHLGVEEAETVNYEIGNLIRWRRNFGNAVLIMFVNGPVNRTALEWRLLYGRIFKTVVILSEDKNPDLAVEYGQLWEAYKYFPKIFDRFKGADGFLFLQDNMILNYWNLLQADKSKLWITNKVTESWTTYSMKTNVSAWFTQQAGLVKKVVSSLPAHFQVTYKGSIDETSLTLCSSEIFYIPRRFVGDFVDLVSLIGDLQIHHKIAVPMMFMAMDSPSNFDSDALRTIVYRTDPKISDPVRIYSAQVPAVYPWNVSSEADFVRLVRTMALGDPLLMEMI